MRYKILMLMIIILLSSVAYALDGQNVAYLKGTAYNIQGTIKAGDVSGINDNDFDTYWDSFWHLCNPSGSGIVEINFSEPQTINKSTIYVLAKSDAITLENTANITYWDSSTNQWELVQSNLRDYYSYPATQQDVVATWNFSPVTSKRFRLSIKGITTPTWLCTAGEEQIAIDEWQLFNTTSGVVNSGNVTILFFNDSDVFKSVFDEGEKIFLGINYTFVDNGSVIDFGYCNITTYNLLYENESSDDCFTLCGSGCDYSDYTESITLAGVDNAVQDFIIFKSCHESLVQGSINVSMSCGNNYYSELVLASELPLCDEDNPTIFINSSVCSDFESVNISVSYDGNYNRRKRIIDLRFGREYSEHEHDNVLYNSTYGLYVLNEAHEQYIQGEYNQSAICSVNGQETLNSSVVRTLVIDNIPPKIYINQVNNSYGLTNLFDTINIQYSAGVWQWFGSITDDDFDFGRVVWYNNSGDVLQSYEFRDLSTQLNTDDQLFLDFDGNPFNISVFANDTFGELTFKSLLFNVSDTINPQVSGFDDDSVQENTTYTWDVRVTDEYIYSFNLSCDNGHEYYLNNIGNTSFLYAGELVITDDTVCNLEVCDGHTDSFIEPIVLEKKVSDGIITYNDVNIDFQTELSDITLIKKTDRINFCVKPLNKDVNSLIVNLPIDCFPAKNSKYKGHYICPKSKIWIDFEGEDYKVTTYSGMAVIDVSTAKAEEYCFNSIGELNCVTDTQTITTYVSGGNPFDNLQEIPPLNEVMFFGIIVFLAVALLYSLFIINIPLAYFFGCIMLLALSFYLLTIELSLYLRWVGLAVGMCAIAVLIKGIDTYRKN